MKKILLAVVLALTAHAQERTIPAAERNALLDLYKSTNGESWKNHNGWGGAPGTECDWNGVGCDYSVLDEKIVLRDLYLPDNGLRGTLPASLADLIHLDVLIVTGNELAGPLPAPLLKRFDEGKLRILGYAGQFSPTVEIDLELKPTAVICGDYEVKLKAGGGAAMARKICRNANEDDRATFWERSSGWSGDIDRIARAIETSNFASLASGYETNQTHGAHEIITVIYRDGTRKVVDDYAQSAPAPTWLIKTLIAGAAFNADWQETTRTKPVKD